MHPISEIDFCSRLKTAECLYFVSGPQLADIVCPSNKNRHNNRHNFALDRSDKSDRLTERDINTLNISNKR